MYCLLFAKEFTNKEKNQIKKLTFALNESVRILNVLYAVDKEIILNDILLTDEKLIKLYIDTNFNFITPINQKELKDAINRCGYKSLNINNYMA